MRNARLDGGLCAFFQPQVGGQQFGYILANVQLAQVLQVGQTLEHENAVHEAVGVLHLANRFLVFPSWPACPAPSS
jgi:hypothetical protein